MPHAPFFQELDEIKQEADEFQRRVDAGTAQWADYDEETGAGRHYGEEFSERRLEAEEALLLVRKDIHNRHLPLVGAWRAAMGAAGEKETKPQPSRCRTDGGVDRNRQGWAGRIEASGQLPQAQQRRWNGLEQPSWCPGRRLRDCQVTDKASFRMSKKEEYQPGYQASVGQFRVESASTEFPTIRSFSDRLFVGGGRDERSPKSDSRLQPSDFRSD
jgi:hypothetical protein